jgi:Protein kinase domain
MSVEDPDLPAGTRIAGRYVIDRCVRRGPYVSVYAARGETAPTARFNARVVKLPGPGTDAVGAVNRELQRVALLRQRAVPALVAVVREPVGLVVITERPEGSTLREIIQKAGKLKSGEIGRLVTEVATVLDAMHGASPPMMHRAITPDTIAVADRMLRVWVEECGLAQALTSARVLPDGASMTAPTYRSPGELLGRATASSDVFALASVAYECLTGRPAHEGATDVDTDALILRGPRPSVRAARAAGATEIDAVLHRAWSDESSYPTAGAFARELVRVLTANPSSRGIPIASARPRPEAVDLAAKDDSRKQTLLGVSPTAAELAERNAMKSTLLGIGTPRSAQRAPGPPLPRPAAPFGPPVAPAGTAPITLEGAESAPASPRGRRLSETTQRVEVPRIRPPGTEPIDAAAALRAKTPVATADRPRAAQPEAPAAPAFAALSATLPAGTVPLQKPVISPSLRAPTPAPIPTLEGPQRAQAPEVPTLPVVEEPGTVRPKLTAEPTLEAQISLEPSVPQGERLSDQPWGDISASLGDLEDRSDAPTAPPPRDWTPQSVDALAFRPTPEAGAPPSTPEASVAPPALPARPADPPPSLAVNEGFGVVTADAFDIVSDDDFAPVTPPPPLRSDPPPLPDPGASPPMPVLPVVPQPVTPLGVVVSTAPPPLPADDDFLDDVASIDTPAPPEPVELPEPVAPIAVAPPATPPPPRVPTPAPMLRPSIPAWAPTVDPPPAPPAASKRGVRIAITLGVALFVSGSVLTAGWLYGRNVDRRETDVQVAIVRRPPVTPPSPAALPATDAATATTSPTADDAAAPQVASADAATPTSDASAVVAVADVSETPDAAVAAAPPPDAGEAPVVASADAGPTVAQAGESDAGGSAEGRRHRHPHTDDMDALEERLTPDVQACITDNHRRRHVHVAVRYEGATGRAVDIHVASAYAEPPIGPCIENVIRAHPVEPFTADDYENHFSFESH